MYVIYGAQAPVQIGETQYRMQVPQPSSKAGISRMLGVDLPWQKQHVASKSPVAVGEMFAGGMGGWTQAMRHIPSFQTTIALDIDEYAVKWYVSNNGGVPVQGDAVVNFCNEFKGEIPVVCGDIGEWTWLQLFMDIECQVLTASFPCAPWSNLGRQSGLRNADGCALLSFMKTIRLLQPAAVCFENVSGFRSGKHLPPLWKSLQEQDSE